MNRLFVNVLSLIAVAWIGAGCSAATPLDEPNEAPHRDESAATRSSAVACTLGTTDASLNAPPVFSIWGTAEAVDFTVSSAADEDTKRDFRAVNAVSPAKVRLVNASNVVSSNGVTYTGAYTVVVFRRGADDYIVDVKTAHGSKLASGVARCTAFPRPTTRR